jgi:hypothetical protein
MRPVCAMVGRSMDSRAQQLADQSLPARLVRWAYTPGPGRRDARFDLLRGFAVFAMAVDHFGGKSWFTLITGGNEFLVSAAEGFVFLSGFVMGMVYGGRIRRDGWMAGVEGLLRRAAVLYVVTVGLTLLFVGLFLVTDLRLWVDRTQGLGLTDPVELVVGTFTLHYTYHGTDILWMYTVLIAASPLLFHLLVTGRTRYLLAGSTLLWLAYQLFPARAAIPWVVDNAVYFPVAAWQLYFVVGLAMGYHREAFDQRLGGIPRWPALALCALAFVGLILLDWGRDTGRLATWPLLKGLAGQTYDQVFNKPSVAWGRVVAFAIAAGFFFLLVTQFWRPIERLLGWLLLPLGRAALLAYGLHLIAIVAVYNLDVWGLYDRSQAVNTLLQAVAVGMVWGLVKGWDQLAALPRLLARLIEAPARRPVGRRAALAASVLLLAVTATTATIAGPVRAARSANPVGDPASAGTLVYNPLRMPAATPARVLLVLHGEATTGPMAALPLVDEARQAGWAVVAPTLDYGNWTTQDAVRAAAAALLPGLRQLVDDLGQSIERPTRPRAFVYGEGRGGQLAQFFALFYPDRVRGVATVNALPCTLPLESSGQPARATPLPFPVGLGDVADYTGQPADLLALSQVSFRLQPEAPALGEAVQGCAWLEHPVDPREQVGLFAGSLRGIGADVRIVGTEVADPRQEALRFLAELPVP